MRGLLALALGAALLAEAVGCGKKAPTTPADPAGGATYGGDAYGASEPTGEPRPDPNGGDPDGY